VPLKDALFWAIDQLTAAHIGSPRMNAELLMMFTLNCDRAYLYAHPEHELTAEQEQRYAETINRRSSGFPAQYITGHQEFWGMDLIVSPAVLIPRPETEHLIETVLRLVENREMPFRIVDVGTGSGCIALALAKELPSAEIHATEISPPALEIARANAARHRFERRIRFYEANLLRGLEPGSFDFVVSNPPYVGESEQDQVQLEVRKFEPRTAVFAGPIGTEVIEKIVPEARWVLKPAGWLIFEISGTIADRVKELLSGWSNLQIANDLQGISRIAAAQKPSS
jgi:release factor glutamine methyltransferase